MVRTSKGSSKVTSEREHIVTARLVGADAIELRMARRRPGRFCPEGAWSNGALDRNGAGNAQQSTTWTIGTKWIR